MSKQLGKVKWFNNVKGIGFISQENASDIFVHYKSIALEGHKMLKKGQQVTFQVIQTEFGSQASEVLPVDVSEKRDLG